MVSDRLQPHDIGAEESVIGSILIDGESIARVTSILRPTDFYSQRNRKCYEACLALYDRNGAIDQVSVAHEVSVEEGALEQIGGAEYLARLVSNVPTSIHIEHYANIVRGTSILRHVIRAGGEISELGYDGGPEIEPVLDKAEEVVFGIRSGRSARGFTHIRQYMDNYMEQTGALHDPSRVALAPVVTGFPSLDELLGGGLQRSDLVILAARPSLGKSTLALNMARNAAEQGFSAALFSLEMSGEQIAARLLASEADIDSHRLRMNLIREDEEVRVLDAVGLLSDMQIFVDDTPFQSAMELRSKARRLQQESGLDLLIVDYLQLVDVGRSDNRAVALGEVSRALKALARELDIPVMACSQLSRAVEQRPNHRPLLSDLRESGCLTGDTLVPLADSGRRVPIRDLAGNANFAVWALNQQTCKIERATVSNAFSTGVKPVFKMVTQLGRSIRATGNHKFLTIDGWKRLDELHPEERIAIPRLIPTRQYQDMTDSELALLGHLIGDGCTLPRHAIQYTTRERDLATTVADLAKDVFDDAIEPRIVAERQWFQVYLASTRHHTHGVRNVIAKWLDSLGIFGLRSHEKRVPEHVFKQHADGIAQFLRHLWATDGCIQMRGGKTVYPAIYYASSSEQLAQDVQSLLLRIGISGRLKRVSQGRKGRDQFHVIVSGKDDIVRFALRVGAVGEYKNDALNAVSAYISRKQANTNRDVIPAKVWQNLVKPAMANAGVTHRQLHSELGMAYSGMTLFKQNLGRERAGRIAEVVSSRPLEALSRSDVYWDKIASIEPDGVEEVFDLTVPGPHNFVASDIIAHNSIEQDADVVSFIHREDQYTTREEWERKFPTDQYPENIAEIIVSKHRNGPVGTVPLYFRNDRVRFETLTDMSQARAMEYAPT